MMFVFYQLDKRGIKHMKGSKEHYFIRTKTQSANFRGNSFCQATKTSFVSIETKFVMLGPEQILFAGRYVYALFIKPGYLTG